MSTLSFSIAHYKAKIIMSSLKHLLVEGKTDERLFKLLLSELPGSKHHIVVECAELIRNSSAMSNREKVEAICNGLSGSSHCDKITGFVDREFRGFDIGESVKDTIGTHHVAGRVVWSRGHSIENYFFCIDVLRKPLRSLTKTVRFDEILSLFEPSLLSVLRIASAVSLTALDNGLISLLGGSISIKVFRYNDSILSVETDEWKKLLMRDHKLDENRATKVIEDYAIWIRRLTSADESTCKWICHGHTGMSIIFAAYEFFAHQPYVVDGKHYSEQKAVSKLDQATLSNICADNLAELSIKQTIENPINSLNSLLIF